MRRMALIAAAAACGGFSGATSTGLMAMWIAALSGAPWDASGVAAFMGFAAIVGTLFGGAFTAMETEERP